MRSSTLKRIFIIIAVAIIVFLAIIASIFIFNAFHSKTCNIAKQNSSVILKTNIQQLREADINYGDEVEITFSTGYKAVHVPIYTDDFGIGGDHVIYAKTDNEDLHFCFSHEDGVWEKAGLKDSDTATIQRAMPQKFSAALSGFQKGYSQVPEYIIGNRFFRGINNKSDYTIDLDHDIQADGIDALNLPVVDIKKKDCNDRIVSALLKMPDHGTINVCTNAPTYYFITLLKSLAGSNYEELANDYMSSYHGLTDDEYNSVKENTIDKFLHKLTRTDPNYDMNKCDMNYCAVRYLRSTGVSTDDIELILKKLV